MNTLGKQNKITEDAEGETNGGDSTMFESDVVDLPLAKGNIGEGGEQGKKKKKKKRSEERKHGEHNQFKSDECEEGDDGKKMKKKRRLIEGDTLKDCDDFRSNGGEDGEEGKKLKKKKKKLSEESKQNDYKEVKSKECEEDELGKKMKKKKKLIEGNTLNVRNDFSSNEGEDGEQAKKLKKKKKKQSEESKHKDYNKDKSNECENDGHEKKVKKKKKVIEEGRLEECNDVISNGDGDKGKMKKKSKPSHKRKSKNDNDFNNNQGEVNDQGKKMKKKKETKTVTNESPNSASKPKRVTFSDHVEEFCCDGLVRGRRYTPEEDEKIKAAVHDYLDSHGLGDDGIEMILRPRFHPSVKGCWKLIAQALPHRPPYSVRNRGQVLFENNVEFEWTPEEREFVRKAYVQHGPDSRAVADALGKSRFQVKDLWRRLKYTELKKGAWSQDEYQTLFNLVNQDLRIRALEPYRKSKHGMLRDNISWEAISHKLKTRDSAICCMKWYNQLVSPMTADGEWIDSDDFRLIGALYALDACSMEEVDWDNLIEHRSGDVCRQRWDQMVQHIGERAGKSFIEQVEILAKRFCPDLLEAREAFENKPVTC